MKYLTQLKPRELKKVFELSELKILDDDFRDNFERYFNKEYVLRYYLFVLVFGAVDKKLSTLNSF